MEMFRTVQDDPRLVGVLVFVFLVMPALRNVWKTWRFVRASVQTRGEIVAYPSRQVKASNEDGTYMRTEYSQVIRYTDRDGVTRTFNGPYTGSRKRNTIGTSIAIRYHPQQAVPPQVDSVMSLYGQPIRLLMIFAAIYAIMLIAA